MSSVPDQPDNPNLFAPPKGWRFAPGRNGIGFLLLTKDHPAYPAKVLKRAEAQDAKAFGNDPKIQRALDRIAARLSQAAQTLYRQIQQPRDIDGAVDRFSQRLIDEVNNEAAKLGPHKLMRRRQTYMLRRTHERLAPKVAAALDNHIAPYSAPFVVAINVGDKPEHPELSPFETMIRFDALASLDLTMLGQIIPEAQRLAGQAVQAQATRSGPRPKPPSENAAAITSAIRAVHGTGKPVSGTIGKTFVAQLLYEGSDDPLEALKARLRRLREGSGVTYEDLVREAIDDQ